jgi:hypothetical protein
VCNPGAFSSACVLFRGYDPRASLSIRQVLYH